MIKSFADSDALTGIQTGYEILIVEDDDGDARFFEIMLQSADIHVSTLNRKITLHDALKAYHPGIDAVFLDLGLPDSKGPQTLKTFLEFYPNANVIVMTGQSDGETGLFAVKAGAQDFIPKGQYDDKTLMRSLYYSVERNNILKRFEETQRIARVASWEFNYGTREASISDNFFIFFKDTPTSKRFFYKNLPNYREYACYPMVKTILTEVYDNFILGKRDIIKKEVSIDVDGKKQWFAVQGYISRFHEGSPVMHGIFQDVTEQKESEYLRQEKELAEESAKMKEVFITNVSHEMRTPMNAILGMSHILMNTQMSGEQLECVDSIKRSSELLLGIVNDILEISSLQNGNITFDNKDFDLHQLTADLADVMQYKLAEKEMLLYINTDVQVPKILVGDQLRLNQILYNLVGNAIKFTDTGRIDLKIKYLGIKNDEKVHLQFEVHDTGIGIPEDKLDMIFETFARVRSKERLFEGTGLGLSIARNIVNKHGGRIWATSTTGKGSIFYFTMKLDIAKNQNEVEKVNKYKDLKVNPEHTFRLLLVEDNKLNQLVAKKTLEKQWPNITLQIAEHGGKAVEILERETFDIILMDIQMPVMDGYETTHHIRTQMPQRANIPILAMTAFAHISKEDKFKEFGLDDFVLKPFDPEDLYHKIAIYTKNF